jgi:hypothetical protein
MVIQLKTTYYHYCEIDVATVQGLQSASSKRQFFEARIRGSGSDGPFDWRTSLARWCDSQMLDQLSLQ